MKVFFSLLRAHLLVWLTLCVVFIASPARSQVTWTNSNGNNAWSTAANWNPATEPTATSAVIFPSPTIPTGNITLTSTENALSIQFDDAYTLSGGTLALASGNSIGVAADVTATINNAITITGGLTKNGLGTLVLGGSNTNPGGTQITAGILRAANIGALGTTGIVTTVQNGATLESAITLDRPVTLLHGSTIAGVGTSASNGVHTIDAAATSITLATRQASDVFTLGNGANDLTGGSATTVIQTAGPGIVRLGAASNFTGSWQVPEGRLELANATSLGNSTIANVTLAGGELSGRVGSATLFTASPGNNLLVTANSTLLSDRTSNGAGFNYTFGSLGIGNQTLTVAPGPAATSGTASITLGNVTLTGNPTFAINDSGATNGKLITGSLLGGATPRQIVKTGAGDLALTGGATALAAGSTFTASGGGVIEMLFPDLGAATTIAVDAAQNPFGEASLSLTDETLVLAANGASNSTAQTYQIASAISLAGNVMIDPIRRSGSGTSKTFELPGLSLAAGTTLAISGNNSHNLRLSGPLVLAGTATLSGVNLASKTSSLTLDGGISGGVGTGLIIEGGTSPLNLTVNATSTYGGGSTINGGSVTLNAASALGSGPTSINGGTVTLNAANAIGNGTTLGGGTLIANQPAAISGSISISGGTLRTAGTNVLAANTVSLNGGTLDLRNNTTADMTIGNVTVSGNSTLNFANNGSGTSQTLTLPQLSVSGDTTLTITNANSFTPSFGEISLAGNLTLDSAITTRIQSLSEDLSPRSLIKTGTGTLELKGASSHSGGTEILAGILLAEHSQALGSGSLTIGPESGTATATARFLSGLVVANDIIARTGGSGVLTLDANTGNVTWNGNVDLQRTLTVNSATNPSTLDGIISGSGNIIKTGTGEIVLGNASNSFGSGTADSLLVNAGILTTSADGALGNASNGVTLNATSAVFKADGNFSTNRTLTFNSTGTTTGVQVTAGNELTFNGTLAGSGSFNKTGPGIMTLAPTVDSSGRGTALTSISAGTLRVQSSTGLSNAGNLTLSGGTVEFLSDTNTDFAHPVTLSASSGLHVGRAPGGTGSNGRHTLGALASSSLVTLTVTGEHGYGLSFSGAAVSNSPTITNNAPAPLVFGSFTGNPGTSNPTLTISGSGDVHIDGALSEGPGTGNYGITKTGTGTLRFGTSVAEFGRALTLRDGTLDLNGLAYTVDSLTLGGTTAELGPRIVTGGAGSLNLTSGLSYSNSNNPPAAIITGRVDIGSTAQTFSVLSSTNATTDLTIAGPITGSSGSSLLKSGSGVLRMSGAGNTMPGLTTVSTGTLELAKTSGQAVSATGLHLTGGTARLLADEQIADNAPVSAIASTTTIVDLNGRDETIGSLSLTQSSSAHSSILRTGPAGTLFLLGNLSLHNNVGTGAGARNVLVTGSGTQSTPASDGTLDLGGAVRSVHVATTGTNANANATIETRIINGGILKTGPRTLFLSNPDNQLSGGIQIAEGMVVPANLGALGGAVISFANTGSTSATLNLGSGTGTLENDFTIGGDGDGASTLLYSAASPLSLTLSGNISLQRDLTIDVVNGTTTDDSSAVLDITGKIDDGTGTHGLLKIGNGTLKLAPGNTFGGSTTVNRGALSITADSALGNSTAALVLNGGSLHAAADITSPRPLVFGENGGSVRVNQPHVLEFSGPVTWGDGITGFYGSGMTILSGGGTAGSGSLLLGRPTAFATVSGTPTYPGGHVLSLRGGTPLPGGHIEITNSGIMVLGSGDFIRPLGTGPGTVQLPTNTAVGWAAHGADRIVNLDGDTPLVWGRNTEPRFLMQSGSNAYGQLVLGHESATHTVDFQSQIELNDTVAVSFRRVVIGAGAAAIDARLSGGFSNTPVPTPRSRRLNIQCFGNADISGPLAGNISFEKAGPGTAILSGDNSAHVGTIFVDEGILTLAGDVSLGSLDIIEIAANGTLDASALTSPLECTLSSMPSIIIYGVIIGDVRGRGIVEGYGHITGNLTVPADSYVYPWENDMLHIGGNFTLEPGGEVYFFSDSDFPGDKYHNPIRVEGSVTLAGILDFYLDMYSIEEGDTFVFIHNDGDDPIQGTFENLPEGTALPIRGNKVALITYQANGDGGSIGNDFGVTVMPGGTGSDVTLTANIPEYTAPGSEIVITHTITNTGPYAVSLGHFEFHFNGGAEFVSSTPAGTFYPDLNTLIVEIPALLPSQQIQVEVRLNAPQTTGSVTVFAEVDGYYYDTNDINNYLEKTIIIGDPPPPPSGPLVLESFTYDKQAGSVSLGIQTQNNVTYLLQRSENLIGWTTHQTFIGNGQVMNFTVPSNKDREFFRIARPPP